LPNPQSITYTAHYNDNGYYRKLALGSNSNCSIIASANGIFDTNGGILESADTGVSLNVPDGAIAKGCSIDLYFKVCHCKTPVNSANTTTGGSGEQLLNTPIVMCGPRGIKFLKPVELQIPHFISIDGQSWSYAFKAATNGKTNSQQEQPEAENEGERQQRDINNDDDEEQDWNSMLMHKKILLNSVTVKIDCF
jgi:hypothetical protein